MYLVNILAVGFGPLPIVMPSYRQHSTESLYIGKEKSTLFQILSNQKFSSKYGEFWYI